MTSTSSTMIVSERDASIQVLSSIMEKLNKKEQQKLNSFLPDIEAHILKTIGNVPEDRVKRKRRETIFAAAIYDTFLQYQQRTTIKVNVTCIADSMGLKPCAVNKVWLSLFDTRIKINLQCLERVRGKSKNPKNLVTEVVTLLNDAIVENSKKVRKWFASVETEAKELLGLLNDQSLKDYPPDILAVVAVYGVIRRQGKAMVPLSQLHASLLCRTSSSMISSVWLEVFGNVSVKRDD